MSKVPLIVGLQKVIQAIKNWLPFTPGENATTYAPYGINFGTDTIVGIKGYRIIDMQPAREVLDDAENVLVEEGGTYTLELEPGETIDERILNQKYTIYIKATSERVGVIEKIEGNVVTVKPFYWPNKWPDHVEDIGEGEDAILGQQYYYDNSFFVCDAVPDAGNKYFGEGAYAAGNGTRAHGFVTHAEGSETLALGKAAHTEGIQTYAGYAGHAQNMNAKAIGLHSHAQNYYTTAKGDNSDAGGSGTKANGKNSVTRGEYTEANGKNAIANGWKTKAIGDNSDAGGFETETEGLYSFGRGYQNKAKHKGSALFGRNNTSSREMQFLAGQFADTSDKNIMAAVGIGSGNYSRQNGLAVYADGRVRAGKGGTSGNDLITVEQLTQQWTAKDISDLTHGDVIKGVLNPVSYGLKFYGYSDKRWGSGEIILGDHEYIEGYKTINQKITVYPGRYYVYGYLFYWDAADTTVSYDGEIYIKELDRWYGNGDYFDIVTKQELTIDHYGVSYHNTDHYNLSGAMLISADDEDHAYPDPIDDWIYDYAYGEVSAKDLNNHKANIKISKQARNYCVLMNERLYTDNKLITPISSNNLDDFPSRANNDNFGTIISSEDIVINNGIPKINTNSTNFQNGLKPLDQKIDNVKNSIIPQKKAVISTSNSEGWYRIAKASAITTVSGIFKVTASIQAGGLWSEIIFIASKAFGADGAIKVLNHQKHTNGAAIDNIRIGYSDSTASTPAYIDIHCNNNYNSNKDTVTISVELLDKTNTDTLTGGIWQLLDIVQEDTTKSWTYAKRYYMRDILCENVDGSAYIATPENPSDNHIANVGHVNKAIQPLNQRLSFLEGGLLEYNEGYNLQYAFMDHPEGAETGWCFYSPIEEGNPYTKVRLGGIYITPYYPTVANVTVSYIDGVSADGTERERLFTLDEATRRQIFDFVMQHEEEIYSNNYWLYVGFRSSYVEVTIEEWNQFTVVYSIQIPYSVPTNLIFDCKDYKYLDFNCIDHVVEPMISVAKLGFKKEN